MRIAIATLLGGLVMFLWGAFAHMVLPIGEMSVRAPLNEDKVLAALHENLPNEHAIFILPYFDMAKHDDPKAVEAFSTKAKASPFAFIVYAPYGRDYMQMGYNLFHQWLSDTIAALLIALILVRSTVNVIRGLYTGLAFGVFAWLSLSVPFWNWYRFPMAFTFGTLIEQAFGWLLAGAVIGWWLGRGVKRGFAAR
jgi:heme exporter protein D